MSTTSRSPASSQTTQERAACLWLNSSLNTGKSTIKPRLHCFYLQAQSADGFLGRAKVAKCPYYPQIFSILALHPDSGYLDVGCHSTYPMLVQNSPGRQRATARRSI